MGAIDVELDLCTVLLRLGGLGGGTSTSWSAALSIIITLCKIDNAHAL